MLCVLKYVYTQPLLFAMTGTEHARSQRPCSLKISGALNSVRALAQVGTVYVNKPQSQPASQSQTGTGGTAHPLMWHK